MPPIYRAGYTNPPPRMPRVATPRVTAPGHPAYRPPRTPALPPLGPIAHTRAQNVVDAQIQALPTTSEVSAPYESQAADIKGLTQALIQHLQGAQVAQVNLATGLPQMVQTQAASLAAQQANLVGAAGGNPTAAPPLPATGASSTLAGLGTSYANQFESQAAAAPTAALAYDAQVRNNEQKALADYILGPSRQIAGTLPQTENTIYQQLQGQRNTDRSLGLQKSQADRTFAFNKSQAAERVNEFNASKANQLKVAKINEDTTLRLYGKKAAATSEATAADQKFKADQAALDRQTRVRLAKIQDAGAQRRAAAAAAHSTQAAARANAKEGRSQWSSALNKMYSVIDAASKPTTSGAMTSGKKSFVVTYTPPASKDSFGNVTPPKPTTRSFSDWNAFLAWRNSFYKTNPGGRINYAPKANPLGQGATTTKSSPGNTSVAKQRAFTILKQTSDTYGLGFSDGYIRQVVNSYAGQPQKRNG